MTNETTSHTAARFTTLWGGGALAASALLSLLMTLPFVTLNGVTALSWYEVSNAVTSVGGVIAALLLAGAVYCLGLGIRGDAGLVGQSQVGRVAVLLAVAAMVVKSLIRLFFIVLPPHPTAESLSVWDYLRSDIQVALAALSLVCVVVAVVVVVRRGVLNRALRWGLVIVVAWMLLVQVIQYIPFPVGGPGGTFRMFVIVASNAYVVGLLLQGVLGVGIALYGQSAALRRRAAIINEHW